MIIETERLRLRPWKEEDACDLYMFAKDPNVGPAAGWPVHTSVENSREIIQTVLSAEGTFAVVLKEEQKVVGSVGIMIGKQSNLHIQDNEAEVGYWIGVPYWGKGLIPEAVYALQTYAFETLGIDTLWCGYFDGNTKSKCVQEKCGFQYHHTNEKVEWKAVQKELIEHVTCLKKDDWLVRIQK